MRAQDVASELVGREDSCGPKSNCEGQGDAPLHRFRLTHHALTGVPASPSRLRQPLMITAIRT